MLSNTLRLVVFVALMSTGVVGSLTVAFADESPPGIRAEQVDLASMQEDGGTLQVRITGVRDLEAPLSSYCREF